MPLDYREGGIMKPVIIDSDVWTATKDTVVILDFEGGERAITWLSRSDKSLGDLLSQAVCSNDFRFKDDQVFCVYSQGKVPARRLLFAGLGKKDQFHLDKLRAAVASAVNYSRESGIKELAVRVAGHDLEIEDSEFCVAVVESAMLAFHRYDVHKTEKDPVALERIILAAPAKAKSLEPSLKYAAVVASKTAMARDLENLGSTDKPPKFIVDYVKKRSSSRVKVSALWKSQLQRLGAGGILAVNRGSSHEPCFLVMEYNLYKKDLPLVVLVGKGIVFDSGGHSLKDACSMENMKCDLCGAVGVIHAAMAAAELDLPVRVVAIAALTENAVGPDSYKPGDFIKMMSGKTVEILNTDAEGRLVLADALHYAKRYRPDFLIDMATLTGACFIALGSECAGLFSNDDQLKELLVQAGEDTHERLWALPLWDEYGEYIKSDFADLKNVVSNSRSGGGAITAAKFLQNFVDKEERWAHIDIAGVDWHADDKDYRPKGATGYGVRLLTRFLSDLGKQHQ